MNTNLTFLTLATALFIGQATCQAQDTLKLDLKLAEQIFLEKNFALLAQKANISLIKAQEIQTKLWDNPQISFEQSIYNPQSKRAFPLRTEYADGTQGQNIFIVSQLFLLAGKRNKRFQMAQLETQIAEQDFYDLLRTLKYTLRTTFYDLYYTQQIIKIYEEQIASISVTIQLLNEQYKKGNVAWKEVIRLKSFLLTLQNEEKELFETIIEKQATLNTLLGETKNIYYVPQVSENYADRYQLNKVSIQQLYALAQENRQDLKKVALQKRLAELNVNYQKALAIPDLNVQAVYDRNGSYIPNYWGIGVGIQLPVFNRNQGNIASAQKQLEVQALNEKASQNQLLNEIIRTYNQALQIQKLYESLDKNFINEFDKLFDNVQENYQKKNITLLEFLDYYESYKSNIIHINQLQNQRRQIFEQINYIVGTEVF
ncbi:MAG: TolC family protein [Microscillaceae bacterium]|nr:TolC family protein [Microscillaceae bacterium]MDW8460230.1 TolC family protein [Cytophagales bacterium]